MSRLLRTLIVDDEHLARMRLRTLLAECPDPPVQVVAEAGDATTALQWVREHPDGCELVLLDIRMPGRDGMQLAAALQSLPQPPSVVFVTAHGNHALKAFDLDAVDYLTKPVLRERLQAALRRVVQRRWPVETQPTPLAEEPPPARPSTLATPLSRSITSRPPFSVSPPRRSATLPARVMIRRSKS